jgi:HprK-related kinase B
MNWKHVDEPAIIRPVDLHRRRDLLPAITKSRGVFADGAVELTDASDSPDEYLAGLRGCPAFEVVGGVSFETVARHCAALLNERR